MLSEHQLVIPAYSLPIYSSLVIKLNHIFSKRCRFVCTCHVKIRNSLYIMMLCSNRPHCLTGYILVSLMEGVLPHIHQEITTATLLLPPYSSQCAGSLVHNAFGL